jgi:hypothetical protein
MFAIALLSLSDQNGKSDMERYMVITKNNLFKPLGSGEVIKRQEFMLMGIFGRSALIKSIGDSRSYYISEGGTFADGAKLMRIEDNSVLITHEGEDTRLNLDSAYYSGSGRMGREGKPIVYKESVDMSKIGENKSAIENDQVWQKEAQEQLKQALYELKTEREEIKRKIMEMENSGEIDPEAYKAIQEIDSFIKELETSF